MAQPDRDITALLADIQSGDEAAIETLFPLLYSELHELARRQLRDERADHTLNPTSLVHEAYLKLIDQTRTSWENRSHFLGIAAMVMRRILIDYARQRRAERRGGAFEKVTLVDDNLARAASLGELLALDEALTRLEQVSGRASQVVVMRFFAGLQQEEIAAALRVSVPTVQRDWQTARAWLSRELADS
ncbi:MAG: sigma-70 family RNA polymerase sigma factor [Rhodothermales bacterium]